MPLNFVAKAAITAAMYGAQMGLQMSKRIKGPRLDSLEFTGGDYGAPVPRFWGLRRFETQIIWAPKLKEKKKTTKGKGGKYEEFQYFGSWGVLVADHEIDAVVRIKFDKHVVFQSDAVGPIGPVLGLFDGPFGTELKLEYTRNMRIYRGTDTQGVDPAYAAWCEDRYGPDSATAFRGSAVIFFEDIPLEKFGNRIPQVTVEAIRNKTDSFLHETKPAIAGLTACNFSPDFTRMIANTDGADNSLEIWDVANRTRIVRTGSRVGDTWDSVGFRNDGTFYSVYGFPTQILILVSGDGSYVTLTDQFEELAAGCAFAGDRVWLYPLPSTATYTQSLVTNAEGALEVQVMDATFAPTHFFEDMDGNALAVGIAGTNQMRLATAGTGGVVVTTPGTGACAAMDNGAGGYFCQQGAYVFVLDKATMTVTHQTAISEPAGQVPLSFRNVRPGAPTIWIGNKEYSTRDASIVRTVDFDDWLGEDVNRSVYDPINHALICKPQFADQLTWRYLDRVGSSGAQLKDVIDDVSTWCGLDLADVDTSALTQPIAGYSFTQGPAKSIIEPLLDIHDVDARQHDFGIQFINRGAASVATIESTAMVRQDDKPLFRMPMKPDTDLPRRVTVTFADRTAGQEPNTVIAPRPLDATDSRGEETINLNTYAASPAEAQQLADRYLRRRWHDREELVFSVTAQLRKLEPGDVVTAILDGGVTRTGRIEATTIRGSVIDLELTRDALSLNGLSTGTGADLDGHDEETILVPVLARGFALDIPLLRDADNDINPVIYVAAGGYGSGFFPGAQVYRGDDGSYDDLAYSFASVDKSTWGIAAAALPTANPNLWDRGSVLTVTPMGGTLTSVTEADADANPLLNLAVLGDELLQFTTATLQGDGTYAVSGFKRGRRGTEWAVGGHVEGEAFVLVDEFALIELGADNIGDDLSFKVQTLGRSIDSAPAIDLAPFTAASLKPYAPCHFRAVRDSTSGDWTFSWVRRTRIGGNWRGGTTIPLGENSEAYELVIPTSGGSRTIDAASPTATWTSAQQTADYGAPQTSLPAGIAVYQLSDTVGRGFASAAPLAA